MPKEKDDVLICRCNEVSLKEIKEAIKEGARTVKDVKRRTRAKNFLYKEEGNEQQI